MSTLNMEDMQIEGVDNGVNVTEPGFDEVIQEVGEDEFCKIVEDQFTPFVGQEFTKIEEAVKFYKVYGLACGFDVRKYTTKRWRGGEIKTKLLVCNREGCSYSKKISKCNDVGDSPNNSDDLERDGDKQQRKTKVKRIGCLARVRIFMIKGVLLFDQFHAGHNHELVDVKDREFQKLSRKLTKYHKEMIVYNSRLKIGATKTYKMCKEYVNGFENIGASLNDFKNFGRDVKCFINERDGQLFVDYFKGLAETREDFFFDYEVDSDGALNRAIWADGVARRNYSVFGDAVSFDPTYSTNKYSMAFTPFTGVDNHKRSVTFCGALVARENEETFKWVFNRFLRAMGGKEPEFIITDQDPGIIKAVPLVFNTARHRFCMWHIMNKVPVKYGSTSSDYPEFIKKLNAIVWDDELEPNDFDTRWGEIMEEHGVGGNDWFADTYNKRRQWVMAHCRDLRMGSVMRTTQRSESENSFFKRFEHKSGTLVEFWMRFESAMDQQRHTQKKLDNENRQSSPKLYSQMPIELQGSRVYTHAVFDDFQEEVKLSTKGLCVRGFSEINGIELTTLKDGLSGKNFDIQFNPGTYEATCTCMKFERSGIICRHILNIYSSNGVDQIPGPYIAKRWTKDAARSPTTEKSIIDEKQIELTKLWSEVHETVGLLRGREKADVESLCNLIRDFREKLAPLSGALTKHQELEQILGCKASDNITILPPKQSKNKGSGKRMLSNKAKAVAIAAKPKRMCNNCKQMAHHDKRNCPNPFAERPPPSVEALDVEEDDIEEEESDSD